MTNNIGVTNMKIFEKKTLKQKQKTQKPQKPKKKKKKDFTIFDK